MVVVLVEVKALWDGRSLSFVWDGSTSVQIEENRREMGDKTSK